MNNYELALVLVPTLEDEAKADALGKIQEMIAKFGGTIEKADDWGKRRLAYEIKKVTEGFYYFITFSSEASTPAEIEQRLRIMESVLRFLVIRKED